MHHAELLGKSKKTFRMTDEEIAAGIQAVPEFFDEALLLGGVEIDHDVAAKDDVVAAGKKFRFEIVEVELDELFQRGLDGVLVAGFFKIAKAAGVVHGLHLLLGVDTFLADTETGVTDVRGDNFKFPRRGNQGLGRRHIEGQRIAQIVVGQCIANQNCGGVRFLTTGTTGAPNAEIPVAAFLLLVQQIFQNAFLEKIELRLVTKKTGFVDGEVFQQKGELSAALAAREQAVVAIERIELTGFQPALEAVLQKVRTPLVKKHSAFLIDEGLEKLEFGFSELNRDGDRTHSVRVPLPAGRV